MENSYTHNGVIEYKLDVVLREKVLGVTLTVDQETKVQVYKELLTDKYLPIEIKQELKTV